MPCVRAGFARGVKQFTIYDNGIGPLCASVAS